MREERRRIEDFRFNLSLEYFNIASKKKKIQILLYFFFLNDIICNDPTKSTT